VRLRVVVDRVERSPVEGGGRAGLNRSPLAGVLGRDLVPVRLEDLAVGVDHVVGGDVADELQRASGRAAHTGGAAAPGGAGGAAAPGGARRAAATRDAGRAGRARRTGRARRAGRARLSRAAFAGRRSTRAGDADGIWRTALTAAGAAGADQDEHTHRRQPPGGRS